MAKGLSDADAAAINAQADERRTPPGPEHAMWTHVHSGVVTLTIADPTRDHRLEAFREQQRLRSAAIALAQLRQTARSGAPEQDRNAVLSSLQGVLEDAGATAAAQERAAPATFEGYLKFLEEQWVPDLVARVGRAQNELIAAQYGTNHNPAEDPLLAQLERATLAEWRLDARRDEELGLYSGQAQWLTAESKYFNARAWNLQQELEHGADPNRAQRIRATLAEAITLRSTAQTQAVAARARTEMASAVADAAYEAGRKYGGQLEDAIARLFQRMLSLSLP